MMASTPAVTPVTVPEPETVVWLLLALQAPPVAASVSVIVAPLQRVVPPVIDPATGKGRIDTATEVAVEPHPLTSVYSRLSEPTVTPVTTTVGDTSALPLLKLQVPPVMGSINVIAAPAQMLS